VEDTGGLLPLHYLAAFCGCSHIPKWNGHDCDNGNGNGNNGNSNNDGDCIQYDGGDTMLSPSVVKKFIDCYDAALYHKTTDGDTPLHILVRNSVSIHKEAGGRRKGRKKGCNNEKNDHGAVGGGIGWATIYNRQQSVLVKEGDFRGNNSRYTNRIGCNQTKIINLLMGKRTSDVSGQNKRRIARKKQEDEKSGNGNCREERNNAIAKTEEGNAAITDGVILEKNNLNKRNPLSLHHTEGNEGSEVMVRVDLNKMEKSDNKALERTKHPLLITNREKLTPLAVCALFDVPAQLTRILMKHPLARMAVVITDDFGSTPLHVAASLPSAGSNVALILALGTPEAAVVQDRLRRTPLHVAAQNVYASGKLIKAISNLRKSAAVANTHRGHLPLHLACQSGASNSVVRALVRVLPGSVSSRNRNGDTPLHVAVKYGASLFVVSHLIECCPEAVYIQNVTGNTSLHCATAYRASHEVVQLLIRSWPDSVLIQNRNGDSPLHYAACHAMPKDETVRYLLEAAPTASLLLNRGGQSPSDKARLSHAPEDIVKILDTAVDEWSRMAFKKVGFAQF